MNVSSRGKRVLLAAGAGVLTAALLGGAALAAFAPVSDEPVAAVEADLGAAAPAKGGTDKLKAILDALAARGVITAGQVDAILAAVRDAEPKRDGAGAIKRILGQLFERSAEYLGLSAGDLKMKLPGTSIGAVADATPGKDRAGLIASLQAAANAAIDNAVAANTITREQGDRAKAEAPAQIARFVDHVYEQRAPKPTVTRALKAAEFLGDVVAATREYLGVTQLDLRAAMRDGKSLGEVANGVAGKSRDGLVAHLVTLANTKIDRAAADGKITAEQATALKERVGPAVTALVDRKGPAGKVRP
ncbi:MAG TPA: hypothetical protein VJP45_00280 [Candidatus Limnocylindria bacterium]|nr:hypothetical protein [Candidatus Limnocylindria bacterium]